MLEIGRFRGERLPDGSIVGFDYETQSWVDTSPDAKRDPSFPEGSASNPLSFIPAPF
jgi:hypothetical protein